MSVSSYRGVSQEQDPRFAEKQKKLLASTRFPACFKERVDMRKVALDVVKPWIAARVTEYMGFDDEVLSAYVASLLDQQNGTKPIDPRTVQLSLVGFMEEHAAPFVERLWRLLLSAQTEVGGIPTEILEAKKAEIKAQVLEQQRIAAQIATHHPTAQAAPSHPQRFVARYLGATKAEMDASAIGHSHQGQQRGRERDRSRSPTRR